MLYQTSEKKNYSKNFKKTYYGKDYKIKIRTFLLKVD